jgi:hypothetical protein
MEQTHETTANHENGMKILDDVKGVNIDLFRMLKNLYSVGSFYEFLDGEGGKFEINAGNQNLFAIKLRKNGFDIAVKYPDDPPDMVPDIDMFEFPVIFYSYLNRKIMDDFPSFNLNAFMTLQDAVEHFDKAFLSEGNQKNVSDLLEMHKKWILMAFEKHPSEIIELMLNDEEFSLLYLNHVV